MSTFPTRYFTPVRSVLGTGESFITGAFVEAPGNTGRQMRAGLTTGGLFSTAGSAMSGSFELPRRYILGLTEYRLLVFKHGFFGKPKTLLHALPLTDVTSAGFSRGGMLSNQARIEFRSGHVLAIECFKANRKQVTELLSEMHARYPIAS